MNRRPPPGRRREFPREEGPFDRLVRSRFERDPAPLIIGGTIIFLAILILILFLPPLSLLGGDGDGGPGGPMDVGCDITATRADELPEEVIRAIKARQVKLVEQLRKRLGGSGPRQVPAAGGG